MDYLLDEPFTDDEDFLGVVDAVLHPRMIRQFRERPDHFRKWSENEFLQRFRLSKDTVGYIVDCVSPAIEAKTKRNHALTPSEMVLLTLRFLAIGCFLQVVGDFASIDKSTASRTVYKVVRAIAAMHVMHIKMPSEEESSSVRQKFFNISRFPRCIGTLDCTHVKIQSPGGEDPENYRNRKSYFSFNVQAVCDADLTIRDIVCRWPGSAHDANIFRNSRLRRRLENREFGESLLLGDSGYGIKSYLITPLNNPRTPAEQLFNEAQIRTRNVIERCFGVLKRRFPILAMGIKLNIEKVEATVVSCAVLHNIANHFRNEIPLVDVEIEAAIDLGNIPAMPIDGGVQNIGLNNIVRNALITQYFQSLV